MFNAISFLNYFFVSPIWSNMRNLKLLAQKLSEFWSILGFGGHFVFGGHLVFENNMWKVNVNFHAKSGDPSLKIDWVMINFAIWRPFFFEAILVLKKKCGEFIYTTKGGVTEFGTIKVECGTSLQKSTISSSSRSSCQFRTRSVSALRPLPSRSTVSSASEKTRFGCCFLCCPGGWKHPKPTKQWMIC